MITIGTKALTRGIEQLDFLVAALFRKASTPSSAPCRIVKLCFMARRHYRE